MNQIIPVVVKVVIAVIFTIAAAHIIVAIHDLIVGRQTLTDKHNQNGRNYQGSKEHTP